jgi:hypothetical protein
MTKLAKIIGVTIFWTALLLDALACLYLYQRHIGLPRDGSLESQQIFTD